MTSKKTWVCRLFDGSMTKEEQEYQRKWMARELVDHEVDRPSVLVPEIGYSDEVVCSTTQVPVEGDVIAISSKERWCEISLYCEEIREAIALGEVELLGVVVEYRRDPFEASGDDLKYRKFVRAELPELEATAG